MKTALDTILRQLLVVTFGATGTEGLITGDELTTAASALGALLVVAWSVYKRTRKSS